MHKCTEEQWMPGAWEGQINLGVLLNWQKKLFRFGGKNFLIETSKKPQEIPVEPAVSAVVFYSKQLETFLNDCL